MVLIKKLLLVYFPQKHTQKLWLKTLKINFKTFASALKVLSGWDNKICFVGTRNIHQIFLSCTDM